MYKIYSVCYDAYSFLSIGYLITTPINIEAYIHINRIIFFKAIAPLFYE